MKVLLCEYLYSFATDFAKLSKMWANVHQMNSAIVDNTWNSTLAWHKFLLLNSLQLILTTMLNNDQKHTDSLNFKALALTNLSLVMFQEGNWLESFSQNKYFIKDMVVVIILCVLWIGQGSWFQTNQYSSRLLGYYGGFLKQTNTHHLVRSFDDLCKCRREF
jgi:hypothetical protein